MTQPMPSSPRPGAPAPDALEPMMTLREAASYLNVSERTVRRLIVCNHFPCVYVGAQLRFIRSDVLRWVSARKGA
jgi:excisionase family DNA binding protein